MEESYFPDPEIDSILSQHSKEQCAIASLQRKLLFATQQIENLSRAKRKIVQEIDVRKKTKNSLVEQAKQRNNEVLQKWIDIAPRYGICTKGPFSLLSLLPNELRILIFSFMPIRDILFSVAQASTELNSLVSDNVLWHNLYAIRWRQLKVPKSYTAIQQEEADMDKDWKDLFVSKYRLENNWKKGKCKTSTLIGHNGIVTCLHFQGDTLVTGCSDKLIRVWDMKDRLCVTTLEDHTGGIECLQYDSTNGRIVSGARDCTIKLWDIETEDVVASLEEHTGWVTCLQFNDSTLVSGSGDNTVRIWDMNVGTCVRTIHGHKKFISALQFQGNQLITGSRDRTIKMWDLRSGAITNTLRKHTSIVECLKFKDDTLVSSGDDRTLQVWSLRSGQCMATLGGHGSWARCLQLSQAQTKPQVSRVVSGSDDSTIKVWNLAGMAPKCNSTLRGHASVVTCLQFKRNLLVSGSVDKTVRIWDFSPPASPSSPPTSPASSISPMSPTSPVSSPASSPDIMLS